MRRRKQQKAAAKSERVTVDRRELLHLLDHVDSLVRYCSVSMMDVARYDAGANALWAVVWRLKGDDATADKLAAKVPDQVR